MGGIGGDPLREDPDRSFQKPSVFVAKAQRLTDTLEAVDSPGDTCLQSDPAGLLRHGNLGSNRVPLDDTRLKDHHIRRHQSNKASGRPRDAVDCCVTAFPFNAWGRSDHCSKTAQNGPTVRFRVGRSRVQRVYSLAIYCLS